MVESLPPTLDRRQIAIPCVLLGPLSRESRRGPAQAVLIPVSESVGRWFE